MSLESRVKGGQECVAGKRSGGRQGRWRSGRVVRCKPSSEGRYGMLPSLALILKAVRGRLPTLLLAMEQLYCKLIKQHLYLLCTSQTQQMHTSPWKCCSPGSSVIMAEQEQGDYTYKKQVNHSTQPSPSPYITTWLNLQRLWEERKPSQLKQRNISP